ncbi:MAG: CinA family protein [Campylobacterota bacterium]|nr:CinA family protein [Campylobacterota bacterium]
MVNQKVQMIIDRLRENRETISFAESCTGGRIVSEFTAISGASDVFSGSCVTYSNEIKHLWLGVSDSVLDEFGAVSEECVSEMLDGICEMAKSNYAIAISGIAGPTGGTELKPVGTVYIGILTPQGKEIFHCLFKGDRESVQKQSTTFSIEKLAQSLIKRKDF